MRAITRINPAAIFLFFGVLVGTAAFGQMSNPILSDNATKVSDHVWAIMGFPNVAIIVGDRATLVVDTGLGTRNGATVARVVAGLSKNQKLFLTTTHFHPEHAGGEPGFPANTILIRDAVQQKEMEEHGAQMIHMFSSRSAVNKELLAGVKLRAPDILFDTEATLDLGGVSARLLWFGGAHTKGDELTFVEPDGTLVSGDVVQNKVVPNIFGDGGTPSSWLAVLDKISALNVRHVLPDHSAPGDGTLVAAERAFISDVRARALALKARGVPADEAGKQLSTELKEKYPDWPNMNVSGFVRSVYAE
jgi:glyoxylase-like metal-dependent hydrolase (beta-lactamase superfamily II)